MANVAPRHLRVFDPSLYHEVTQRIRLGKFLLDPNCPLLKAAIYGQLAESMARYGVTLLGLQFMTDHFHALYGISCPYKFAKFLAHFHAGITRAYNKLQAAANPDAPAKPVSLWHEMKWMPVATDEETISWRLAYLMGQAVAANLVDHPIEFPAASTIDAMIDGTPMIGRTYDEGSKYRDSRRQSGPKADEAYAQDRVVTVTPPSCWAHLPPQDLRQRYIAIADSVARVPLTELRGGTTGVQVGAATGDGGSATSPSGATSSSPSGATQAARGEGECEEPGLPQVPTRDDKTQEPPSHKRWIPPRLDEHGRPFEAGPPKAKRSYSTADGKRKKAPLILARSPTVCDAYEAAYSERVEQYLAAKRDCRASMQLGPAGLRAPGLAIPSFMLFGSLPYPRTEKQ